MHHANQGEGPVRSMMRQAVNAGSFCDLQKIGEPLFASVIGCSAGKRMKAAVVPSCFPVEQALPTLKDVS